MGKKKRKYIKPKKVQPTKENRWIEYPLLGILVVGAFLLRSVPSWNRIFVDGQIWYRGVDAWYHMRLVDNMMANFPIPLKWDLSALYPSGVPVGYFPLLSWLIAIPGQVFNYEVVGALLPPILGALTLVPVFYIGKILFNKWVGLFSCLLIAILPTEFFHRTMLGFADHHVLEVFFSVSTILFLILSYKENKVRYPILAGISLGLYLSSWSGGLLLVLPIWLWFVLILTHKLVKGEPIDTLCKYMTITFLISFLIFLPHIALVEGTLPFVLFMFLVTLTPYTCFLTSKVLSDWPRFVIVAEGALILFILFCALYYPQIFQTIRSILPGIGTTIEEAAPSLPRVLSSCYGISFLLSLGGLVFSIKNKQNLLLIIWASFMLLLALGQRRWGYYFTISNAIMASYFIYLISGWVGKNARVATIIVVCVFVLMTNIKGTIGITNLPLHLTKDWYQACVWLKENTPDPFGGDAYHDLNPDATADYGILSWWDYGHWILRVGRRVPLTSPTYQDVKIQGGVLVAQSEEEANKKLGNLNIKYIIIDEAMVTTKFYAIAEKSPYTEEPEELRPNSFTMRLWLEQSETWEKIYQVGKVKIFERRYYEN